MSKQPLCSLWPKVLILPTQTGELSVFRGSCGGCGAVSVLVGEEGCDWFRRHHAGCPDEVVRLC
jgi:hypothetical protein